MTPEQLQTHRKRLKRQRAQLSKIEQQTLSKQMSQRLLSNMRYRSAKHIAIYIPVRGEADPRALRLKAARKQRFYLPILSPWREGALIFIEWNEKTRFRMNRFKIPEPILGSAPIRFAKQLDIIITPLVGFDINGHRMGMGGGFYDRTFAFKKTRTHHQKPRLIGYAYNFQRIKGLTAQSWDVPLNAICTESYLQSV